MIQTWQGVLVSQQADGPAVANTTTETSMLLGQAKCTIPANTILYTGQAFRVRAMGRVSNIVTTPGTLTLRFKMGPTATIAAASTGALAVNVVAKTTVTWILDMDMTVRAIGSGTGTTLMASGSWQSESVIGSPAAGAGGASAHIFPATAPAVGTGFDCAVANLADLTAQWSIANAGNTITCHTFKLESIN